MGHVNFVQYSYFTWFHVLVYHFVHNKFGICGLFSATLKRKIVFTYQRHLKPYKFCEY